MSIDFATLSRNISSGVGLVTTRLTNINNNNTSNSTIDLAEMFELQFYMQTLSQLIEAESNVLTACHTELITMARAVKGG